MAWVAGVDGCSSGWIVCLRNPVKRDTRVEHIRAFADVFRLEESLDVVAVDMPIGLPDPERPRSCETLVRRALRRRRTSVFSTPARSVVETFGNQVLEAQRLPGKDDRRQAIARVHRAASQANQTALGTGLSLQSLFIMPKILEVDRALADSTGTTSVIETHPELIFCTLAGGTPLETSKQTAAGVMQRLELLSDHGYALIDALWSQFKRERHLRTADATIDDVVDSAACCLTAEMHERMATEPFPPDDASDTHGRPMRIWAPIVRSTNP